MMAKFITQFSVCLLLLNAVNAKQPKLLSISLTSFFRIFVTTVGIVTRVVGNVKRLFRTGRGVRGQKMQMPL